MAKNEDTLAALMQLRRALSQGRDIASGALGRMIQRVEDGGSLEPNPEPVRAPRQQMKPMVTQPAPEADPTDEPSDEPDEPEPKKTKTKAEKQDDA